MAYFEAQAKIGSVTLNELPEATKKPARRRSRSAASLCHPSARPNLELCARALCHTGRPAHAALNPSQRTVTETPKETPMSQAIEGLKPALVWKYFAEICQIPRGSKNEEAIARYVLDTAKKLGLDGEAGRLGQRRRAEAGLARAREGAERLPAGPPRHGLREEQGQGARLPQGPHRAGPQGQRPDGQRHDARRRQRRSRSPRTSPSWRTSRSCTDRSSSSSPSTRRRA